MSARITPTMFTLDDHLRRLLPAGADLDTLVDLMHQRDQSIERAFLRDAPEDIVAYTPTATQGGGGIVYTSQSGAYQTRGPWIEGEFRIVFAVGTGGTAGTAIDLNVPVTPLSSGDPFVCGSFILLDSGLAYYEGSLSLWSSTAMRMYVHNVGNQVGATPNFGLAVNDVISGTFRYRWR